MNSEEFARRLETIRPMLYRICCIQLYNPSDREDAIQEAIFKAWKKRGTLREEQFFNTWFVRILINECRNIQKRQQRTLPLEDMEVPARPSQNTALRLALESLDEKQRMCILLHHIEGYSVRDTASMLGISESAAKLRLLRGRKRLKELLSEEVFQQ